jgi:hypothetical protein
MGINPNQIKGVNGETLIDDIKELKVLATSGSGSLSRQQVTKLGVVADSANPRIVELTIPETVDFNRAPIEVLQFLPGEQNVIKTVTEFSNSDKNDFITDNQVEFSDSMQLKISQTQPMLVKSELGEGKIYSTSISLENIKKISDLDIT